MPRLLVLFDLDGTLLVDDAYAHGRAMVVAAREVYAVDLPDDAVMQVDPVGKTDRSILRHMLHAAGLDDGAVDASIERWQDAAAQAFVHEAEASAAAWKTRDGTADALAALRSGGHEVALVTGNLAAIAAAKIERMGLSPYVDLAAGAYGSDSEERADLVPLARERAGGAGGPWPRERAVLVGDTPADAKAAAADGVRCLLFAGDRLAAAGPLDGAEVVLDLPELLRRL